MDGQQNMEGTLTLFHSRVRSLFDTSASNSFIVVRMMNDLGLVPRELETVLNARSPLGVTIKLGKVCKDCPLTLENRNFAIDLIILSMSEFDVILGIDWLTKYGAILDHVSKSITFTTLEGLSFKFQCKPSSNTFHTIHLAAIESTEAVNTLEDILVVQDFEDVFHDILGLPPKREIDFCIELVPGTLPISKTPYRMAPTEMLELTKQVQDLEDLGFVRLSTSPLEHQCYL